MANSSKSTTPSTVNRQGVLATGVVVSLLWLVILTAVGASAWHFNMLQAESNSDAIYRLTVESANQRAELDALHAK